MIFPNLRVPASGPRNARLAAIGMAPAQAEINDGVPFTGPSGKIFNDALSSAKTHRSQAYVTNLCGFFIDDNDLYSVPKELMDRERQRVFAELDQVQPNCLLIMGGDTLHLLTGKEGITKWRGSIFQIQTPSGRIQKCVAAMHPANFIRGQWKWFPVYKYIDVPRAVTQSSSPDLHLTTRHAIVGPSFRTSVDFLREANTKEWISIDYEGRAHITCLGLGWTSSEALCIPLSGVGNSCYWSSQEESTIWKLWCELLQNPKVKKIAHNAPFEWIKSWLYGIYPNPLGMCTMHAHHRLYPDFGGAEDEWLQKKRAIDNPGHGLAFCLSQYTDIPYYKDDGRHWRPELGERKFWEYNCMDVMGAFELATKMRGELEATGLWEPYCSGYLDQFEPALAMEWHGVLIDVARRGEAKAEFGKEMAVLKRALREATGYEIITKVEKKGQKPQKGVLNLASSKQMQRYFYDERKFTIRRNRQTGRPTVDKDALQAFAIKYNDPSLQGMLKLKQIQDLINDVIDQELDAENHIHCHFKQGGTNGSRWSSTESILGSGTNLQNLPRQGIARSLFLPA